MSSSSIVKADPANPTVLEFDISIEGAGLKRKDNAVVRFVLHTNQDGDRLYACKHEDGNLWSVSLPALKEFNKKTLTYTIEVVVDGYFFEAADGDVVIAVEPKAKAKVAPAKTRKEKEVVTEASGGGEVTGQYAPTNDLLKPEYEPPRSHAKAPGTEKDDEFIDKKKLSDLGSKVVPGEGTEDSDIETFDPRQVAADLIKSKFGRIQKPTVKGSLFKRDGQGKVVVETADDRRKAKEERSAKVREILKST